MMRGRLSRALLAGVMLIAGFTPAAAQKDSLERKTKEILETAPRIRWWEAAVVVGGVAALSLLDEPFTRLVNNHRSHTLGDIATVFRQQGEQLVRRWEQVLQRFIDGGQCLQLGAGDKWAQPALKNGDLLRQLGCGGG